jgi:hypothetical protein
MLSAKKILCMFLIFGFVAAYVMPLKVAADDVPVWRVAWIVLTDTTGRLTDNGNKNTFVQAASVFEEFIETHTNNAVDIQITHFEIGTGATTFHNSYGTMLIIPNLTHEMKESYDLYSFDTMIIGRNYDNGGLGGYTYGIREVTVNFATTKHISTIMQIAVHEFLHTAELWFRDILKFPLPYDVDTGNLFGSSALHNSSYYGYDGIPALWYAAWFSQTVPNPRYPYRMPKYLGIPPEAWQHTPSRITVTVHPNNGNAPIVDVGQTGRTFQRPPTPEPTAVTGDNTFLGWFIDPEFTMARQFPHRVTGNISFYAKWGKRGSLTVPSDNPEAYINLDAERLVIPFGYSIRAYSVNGGRTWLNRERHNLQNIIIPDRFPKLLNKGLHLVIADMWDSAKKRPADNATIITFPPIQARPRTNTERLAALYNNDTWSLMTRVTKSNPSPMLPIGAYHFAHSTAAQIPASPEWFGADINFDIQSRPPSGDKTRNVFFFRTVPAVNESEGIFIPASRPFRIRPRPFRKAPRNKINYNTETVSLRRGQEYSVDGGTTWTPTALNDNNKPLPLDVSFNVTSSSAIMIRTAATGTRPRSDVLTITPLARATLTAGNLTVVNGKIDSRELQQYRVMVTAPDGTQSWRKMPRINADNAGTFPIRINSTARASDGGWSGHAASETGTLTVTWGVVGQNSRGVNINGVTSAVITVDTTTTAALQVLNW